jgi:divalent metal cation (Fe/Co/Zn/Cd) transporter
MDEADINVLKEIVEILSKHKSKRWIDIHNLKLIKYGDTYHIDCDITLPWYMNISDAHKETALVKKIISENYSKNIDFTIHTDECKPDLCKHCRISACAYRTQEFSSDVEWTLDKMIKLRGI